MMALVWLLLFLSTLLAWLLAPSTALFCVWMALVCAPILSWLSLFFLRRKQRITLEAPAVAGKGQPLTLTLTLPRERWPLGSALVWLDIENAVTGEVLRRRLRLQKTTSFTLTSPFCGGLHCRVVKVWALDFFGLLPLPLPCRAEKRLTVMPATFPVAVEDLRSLADSEDCQDYAPDRRVPDPSETFQIRPYVPGDNLHQIHWKLTGKTGQLLVREGSCPVDHSLLLFVERRCDAVPPAYADALMEAAISVAQGLSEAGIPFLLAWNETQLQQYPITHPDQLPEAIASLLRSPQLPAGPSGAQLWQRSGQTVGRVLYFCHQLPPSGDGFPAPTQTFLCADADTDDAVVLRPESMEETLRQLAGGAL